MQLAREKFDIQVDETIGSVSTKEKLDNEEIGRATSVKEISRE